MESKRPLRFDRRTLDRVYGELNTTPQPLPKQLIEFLNRHGVTSKVSPDSLWPIEPQIIGQTGSKIKFPIYREPNAEVDFSPEAGHLPRILGHFCLCPSKDGEGEWLYLLALFAFEGISEAEKIAKILARLNENPIS